MAASIAGQFVRGLSRYARHGGATFRRQYATEAASSQMKVTFATPTEMFYNESVEIKQVDVPSAQGSFGILPNHVPLLATLKPGIMTVFEDAATKKFFISSGTVTINADSSVQILAEEAVPLDSLDLQAARQNMEKAVQELQSATTEEMKAEATIAVEVGEALVKALE